MGTVQKRSTKMMRGLEKNVCRNKPSERVKCQSQTRQCFGFCCHLMVSCTLGRNGLCCLLWPYLQVPAVLFGASIHLLPAQLGCSQTAPLSIPGCSSTVLSRHTYFISYYSLIPMCEPPFVVILTPNTALRKKRFWCKGCKQP